MVAFRAAFLAVLATLNAQEPPPPEPPALPEQLILLSRVKQHMRQVLLRQPNYTCQMSIERSHRRNPRRQFQLDDQLRLEVALIDGKETFSWPGARKFDERELRDMVGGTSSTGSFALHARAVYFGTAPRFNYLGEKTVAGRNAHIWAFDVPQMQSGYMLRVGDKTGGTRQAVVGYHGEIAIDAKTLDMITLHYTAEEIPPDLGILSTSDTISYERLAIGEESYLLPVMSDLHITDLDGSTNRNRTRFHNCRQYAGESVISFAEPPPEDAAPPPVPKPIPGLPDGLMIEANINSTLVHPVVVGSTLDAILARPARRKGVEYLPKNAILHGRVLRSGVLPLRVPLTYFTLIFEQVEVDGVFADVHLTLDDVLPPQIGSVRQMKLDFEPTERVPKPGHITIGITGNRPDLRKGLRLTLSTVSPPTEAAQ